MMHFVWIFLAGFVSVFAAGFQSRNVNHGNHWWAAGGAMVIALSSSQVWAMVTDARAGWAEAFVYGLSGMAAITSAMWVHERFIKKKGAGR